MLILVALGWALSGVFAWLVIRLTIIWDDGKKIYYRKYKGTIREEFCSVSLTAFLWLFVFATFGPFSFITFVIATFFMAIDWLEDNARRIDFSRTMFNLCFWRKK